MIRRDVPAPVPVAVLGLLAGLAAALVSFQYVTLAKLAPLTPPGRFRSIADFARTAREQNLGLGWPDALLLGLIVLLFAAVAVAEFRGGQLSALCNALFTSSRLALGALALVSLVLVRFYFAPGQLCWAGDAPAHLSNAYFVTRSLDLWELPIWTNFIATGTPYMLFYGFLFFYAVGVADLFLGDFWFALKLVLALAHIASGLGMYLWASSACRSRAAGFVAGAAYVAIFWHTQQVLIMGRLPLSLFYCLLPWPFYAFEQLRIPARRWRAAALAAVALALLAFTHPGYAFWATAFFALYACLRLVQLRTRRQTRSMVWAAGAALVLGAALGAYMTLGMLLERGATGLAAGVNLAGVPDPDWRQLLLWSNYHVPLLPGLTPISYWYGGYLGLSAIALAVLGAGASLSRRARAAHSPALAASVGLLLSLILVLGYRWPLLQALPVVQALNASRYLLFATLFLAFLAGLGARVLMDLWPRHRHRVAAWALLALCLDLGPASFQHVYSSRERLDGLLSGGGLDQLRPEVEALPPGELPPFRLYSSTEAAHAPMVLAVAHLRGLPTFQSFHPGAVRAATWFSRPFEAHLNHTFTALEDPRQLSEQPDAHLIFEGLALLNARYILLNRHGAYYLLRTPLDHSPVLVSSRAEVVIADAAMPLDPSERTLWIIDRTGVDPASATCDRVLLLDGEGGELGPLPVAEVLEHRVWPQAVSIRLRVSEACFARLAYGWYPDLEVRVNGEQVWPWRTAGHFMALRLPAGEHHIEIRARLSPLRRSLLWMDGLLVLAMAAALFGQARVRRRYA